MFSFMSHRRMKQSDMIPHSCLRIPHLPHLCDQLLQLVLLLGLLCHALLQAEAQDKAKQAALLSQQPLPHMTHITLSYHWYRSWHLNCQPHTCLALVPRLEVVEQLLIHAVMLLEATDAVQTPSGQLLPAGRQQPNTQRQRKTRWTGFKRRTAFYVNPGRLIKLCMATAEASTAAAQLGVNQQLQTELLWSHGMPAGVSGCPCGCDPCSDAASSAALGTSGGCY